MRGFWLQTPWFQKRGEELRIDQERGLFASHSSSLTNSGPSHDLYTSVGPIHRATAWRKSLHSNSQVLEEPSAAFPAMGTQCLDGTAISAPSEVTRRNTVKNSGHMWALPSDGPALDFMWVLRVHARLCQSEGRRASSPGTTPCRYAASHAGRTSCKALLMWNVGILVGSNVTPVNIARLMCVAGTIPPCTAAYVLRLVSKGGRRGQRGGVS